ncbi:MAG: FkbM family methyltransferase [bacterium]|nr:FkbM family methyltransferase [bacterium]
MKFLYLSVRKVLQLLYLSKYNKNDVGAYETIGNDYGFMIVPKGLIKEDASILSFGAGEDIEAEIDLIKQYNCIIQLFDPTDISIQYVQKVKTDLIAKNEQNIADKIIFNAAALWKEVGTVKFFKPKEANFVSHSINNIDATDNFVEVPAETIKSIMTRLGLSQVDYIKMDIEGAEYEVLENMLADKINFKAIYLEYHYNRKNSVFQDISKIKHSLEKMAQLGYNVIYCSRFRYFCLVK